MQQRDELLAFISEDGDAAYSSDERTGPLPASIAAVDDPFYRATSDDPNSFDREDEQLGIVHATAIVGHGASATWNVVFEFTDGSTIHAAGSLPLERGRPGKGTAAVTGGSGRFRDARGELTVNVKNPRRWSIS